VQARDSATIRHFFGGLLAIVGALDVIEALVPHQSSRMQLLDAWLPAGISLTGRTGTVIIGLSLLLLAGGVARGRRVAWQLTLLALVASIVLHLVKDLDLEEAILAGWIVAGLWWLRRHFRAASDVSALAFGAAFLAMGLLLVAVTLLGAVAQESSFYDALTDRSAGFLQSMAWIAYGLVLAGLLVLLRPAAARCAGRADRERLRELTLQWGHNPISHLALHGPTSHFWHDGEGCVAYSVRASTAVALGDPICALEARPAVAAAFMRFCDDRGWTCAFFQVEDDSLYRRLGFRRVAIGSEAIVSVDEFSLQGRKRASVRHAVTRSAREGVTFQFMPAPRALDMLPSELARLSGRRPELGFAMGTLATLNDPDITAGLAFGPRGDLQALVSWLPVSGRRGWTLDLMRRGPDSVAGVMEALIARSIEEARERGMAELSLGLAPLRWFHHARGMRHFKAKFATIWEDRYLALPATGALPEVLIALLRVHAPITLMRPRDEGLHVHQLDARPVDRPDEVDSKRGRRAVG